MDRLSLLKNLQKEDPNDPFLFFAIAKEYEKSGNIISAKEYFEKLRENHPDYIGLYYHLAKIYEILEDEKSVIETYEEGIRRAKEQGDQFSLSELQTAKVNYEIDL